MKCTISRAALLGAIDAVRGVVASRNTIPILSNFLLEAKQDTLSLTATDMDLRVTAPALAAVARPGATTVPASTVTDWAKKLPAGAEIEIDADDAGCRMKSGRSVVRLGVMSPQDFPTMTGHRPVATFDLGPADLRALIDHTKFAISTEETRFYLCGIYLTTNIHGTLTAVATDGHRLAKLTMPAPEMANGMPGIIVPAATVAHLRRLVEDTVEPLSVSLSTSMIEVAIPGGVSLRSKLVDGTFPDYERVIPRGPSATVMEIDRATLMAAVDRIVTINTEKSRGVRFEVSQAGLALSCQGVDRGSGTEELEAFVKGPPVQTGFNAKYILAALTTMKGSLVHLLLNSSGEPTRLIDPAQPALTIVVMPMRA